MKRIWVVLIGCFAFAPHPSAAEVPSSARHESLAAPGLNQPVDIEVDQWGVGHIYAATTHDAFFAQGWNAARDRLWQIDLWRKRGLGLLAKSFGPSYVAQDRAARLFLYRGDMAAEWAAYGPDAKASAEAFTAGINAYVRAVQAGAEPLPVEFRLTGSTPDLWAAEDVVRIRSNGLTRNVESEVARSRVACAGGLGLDGLRAKVEPPHPLVVPPGLDPCSVPADVLADYKLATRDVTFAALTTSAAADDARHLADLDTEAAAEGSNNWVIAPSRSATGRAVLANDPHRTLGVPSLRYIVALSAPGLNVIGAGEPAQPGVSLGHNDKVAFGLTIFPIDQEDLYVYDLSPTDPHRYRYAGAWEAMTVVHETIEVRGGPAQDVELDFTRHGPVMKIDPATHRAFAVRAVWSSPGTSAYFGSARYLGAGSADQFRTQLSGFGAPSLNFVYADTGGNIGWMAVGRAPVRPGWDGLMPVPGDGRYEWKGFLTQDQLPASDNPAKGWFASANEMNLPEGYPAEARKTGFEWSDPTRANRIKQVLGANSHMTLADSLALQTDDYSITDMRAVALLAPVMSPEPGRPDAESPFASSDVAEALTLLRAWDGHVAAGSAAAAIAEVWVNKYLGPVTVRAYANPKTQAIIGAGTPNGVVSFLEDVRDHQGGLVGGLQMSGAILIPSLRAALEEIRGRLGPDMTTWTWGALHHAAFVPAAAALAAPSLKAQMTLGPVELPGSATTPRAATYRMDDFNAISGASVRMVMDVGDWDQSRAVNTPGQSGDPMSAQYRDLFPLWAGGEYFPLLFTRPAVDAATRLVIHLAPGS